MSYTDEFPAPSSNLPTRTRILSMEHNFEHTFQQSFGKCVSSVPPIRRSCLKKREKEATEPALKNCVSFDLGKNRVWTIKDWTSPIMLERQEVLAAARIPEGWVFDASGVDVVMTDVWVMTALSCRYIEIEKVDVKGESKESSKWREYTSFVASPPEYLVSIDKDVGFLKRRVE